MHRSYRVNMKSTRWIHALMVMALLVGTDVGYALDTCPAGTELVEGKTQLEMRLLGTLDHVCPGGCPATWCAKRTADGQLIKHGSFASTQVDGTRNAKGEYRDGKRHGKWAAWHENGAPRYTGAWTEDQKSGRWTIWNADGTKHSEGTYAHNEMAGPWTFYYDTGAKWRAGSYSDGQPTGLWTIWNEDGTVKHQSEIRTTVIVD